MEESPTQNQNNFLKKDLLAILILGLIFIGILIVLTIIENNSGQISQIAHKLTEYLVN